MTYEKTVTKRGIPLVTVFSFHNTLYILTHL